MDKKKLEKQVRTIMNQPCEYSADKMEAVKHRAYEEYIRRSAAESHYSKKYNQQKKSRCRRVMTVAALTMAFFVVSVVYTVLMPTSIGSAHNFIRTVNLWINDTFHLGYEYDVPLQQGEQLSKLQFGEVLTFSSLSDALSQLDCNFFIFDSNCDQLSLQSIEYTKLSDNAYQMLLQYVVDDHPIMLSTKPFLQTSLVSPPEDSIILTSDIGEIFIWRNEEAYRGMAIAEGMITQMTAAIEIQDIAAIFTSLKRVN